MSRERDLLRRHRETLAQMEREIDEVLGSLDAAEPGMRPLAASPETEYVAPEMRAGAAPRVVLIVALAAVALAVIGWLIWRASSDRKPETTPAVTETVVEEPVASTAPTVADEPLRMKPAVQDYGVIRKGTRATRQFEVANQTDEPVSIALSRSICRCLYYEYSELVPPKGTETITVTIDGARAKSGELRETVKVTSKKNPAMATAFEVSATVR